MRNLPSMRQHYLLDDGQRRGPVPLACVVKYGLKISAPVLRGDPGAVIGDFDERGHAVDLLRARDVPGGGDNPMEEAIAQTSRYYYYYYYIYIYYDILAAAAAA